MTDTWRLLVAGATGAIGGTVVAHALAAGCSVVASSRAAPPADARAVEWRCWDPLGDDGGAGLSGAGPFDGVCFAQGANIADSVVDFDVGRHWDLYRANCLSVVVGTQALLDAGLLAAGARIAVVSSIWQERARGDKLSYTMTKAAIGGFVRSAAVDLGARGYLVNGVLPGVLDTPMTRSQLGTDQIAAVCAKTGFGRLPDLDTLAATILFLCSPANTSITGQSLAVDLGMSNAHLV